MAFVNKQSGDRAENDIESSGQPIDFDPNDPDVVKVHYDVSAWNFDQRAELSEALAESELPHVWDEEELVVPELVEDEVDAMFEQLEQALGPFPIVLAADDESTEFGLDEWSEADRVLLTQSLVESEIPFRWEGSTVVVAHDAEDVVDDLLDAIEEGELLEADEAASGPPDGALSTIFLAADKLARDPVDARSRTTLLDLADDLDAAHPPYAFAPRTWSRAVAGVGEIVSLVQADAEGAGADESSVAERAEILRNLLRPYV